MADESVLLDNLRYDREIKLPLYARAGIPEVWIVDLENRRMEVFRQPEGETYQTHRIPSADETVAPLSLPACLIQVRQIVSG